MIDSNVKTINVYGTDVVVNPDYYYNIDVVEPNPQDAIMLTGLLLVPTIASNLLYTIIACNSYNEGNIVINNFIVAGIVQSAILAMTYGTLEFEPVIDSAHFTVDYLTQATANVLTAPFFDE